jgi:hypothetical protein
LVSNGVAAAGFAPWALLLLRKTSDFSTHGFPSLEFIDHTFNDLVGTRVMAAVVLVGIVLALLPVRHAVGAEKSRATTTPILVFLVWAGLPIAFVVLIFASTPSPARYLIGSLPALLLASAYGLSRFVRGRAGILVVLTLSVAMVTGYLRYYTPSRADWRGVAAMLKEQPSACVLVYEQKAIVPFSYYSRKQLPCQILLESVDDLQQPSIASNRLFVAFSGFTTSVKRDQLLEPLRSSGWSVRQEFEFNGVDVIEFGKRK